MAHDVISTCPICSWRAGRDPTPLPKLRHDARGRLRVGRFARLDRDQLALLESFLRARGNLREMERELGISYPTVRSRVEALVRSLGFGPRSDDEAAPASEPGQTREDILERLARREISAEDAARAIRSLGRSAR